MNNLHSPADELQVQLHHLQLELRTVETEISALTNTPGGNQLDLQRHKRRLKQLHEMIQAVEQQLEPKEPA